MTSGNPFTLLGLAAVIPLAALAVSGCGGGGGNAAAAPAHTHTTTTVARHAPAVDVATTRLGKVLVNSRGRTVYLFTKDAGTKSACSGACATAWPPLRAGGKQVIYKGHPLYTFIKDTKAGDTNGEGLTAFGGHWFAVSQVGKQVSPKPSSSQSGSSSAPAPAPTPPANNGIPQNNGGDGDADNNGGPDDGDGGI